jgi:integrase
MGSIESYPTDAGRRYRVRYRTPDRRSTQKRGFRTRREAEDYLASVEVAKLRGEWIDASRSRITGEEWSQQWLAAQVQIKPTTLSGYRHALEKHVVPRWGTTRLVDVAHSDVQTWVTILSATLGPSAVRQTYLALSGVMKFAIRDGRLARNPCDDVRLPRLVKRRHGYLSHERVAALVAELGDQGDVVDLLAYTGLRWGETAGLRVGRLDLTRLRLEVVEAVSEPRGQLVWGTPKTHERRSVPFPSLLVEPLAARCGGKGRDDLVFTGADGGVLRGTNFRPRFFDPAVRRLREQDPEFPHITMHDLRHTAASLAISAGANVKAVQRMLGHASAAMTLDVYADLFDDDLDSVASALDRSARNAALATQWPHGRGQRSTEPAGPTLFD